MSFARATRLPRSTGSPVLTASYERSAQKPAPRLALTGHRRPLHDEWVRSIGCWGRFNAGELINDRAPNDARLHVSWSSYRHFKSRWKLNSRKQWTMCFGPAPWALSTQCAEEHARAVRVFPVLQATRAAAATLTCSVSCVRSAIQSPRPLVRSLRAGERARLASPDEEARC